MSRVLRFAVLVGMSLLPAGLWAQANGRIGGTVVDSSEAVIAGAQVVCRNMATDYRVQVTSSADGLFTCPELPIGRYEITVTQTGFQKLVSKDIDLLTNQALDLKLVLKVGNVSESIEVTAETSLVQTTNATVQSTIASRQMQELPLNGRNPLQLVTLTAGAQLTDAGTIAGQQDNRGLTVNGLRATQNNFRLDGGNYTNRFFGSAPIFPNPDTLEEFTVQSSNYGARNSGAGAVVELATRSGTNQFHGSLFHFLRNTKLNARNFFQLERPPFKLNQFGGTFGGPIRKDKTFFFYSYQGTIQRSTPSPVSFQTFTEAQRRGDFSGVPNAVIDPTTGQQFAGNRIPPERLNRLALAVLNQWVPLPNRGILFVSAQNRNIDDHQQLVKIDHQIADRNRLSGRYFFDDYDFQRPFNAPPGFFAANSFRNQSLTLRDTHTFSPNLTFTFTGNFGRFSRTQVPQAPGMKTVQDLGARVPLGTGLSLFPGVRIMIPGFFNLFSGGTLQQTPTTFDYHFAFLYTKGRHTMQFGADIQADRAYTLDASFTPATWFFDGSRSRSAAVAGSGYALADFMLGLPQRLEQDSGRTNDLREKKYHFFFQDDWKVNSRLTLNLGMRWEPWLPPYDLKNNLVGFAPGQQSTVAPNAPLGLVYPGDKGIIRSVFPRDWNNLAPRIGFAYDFGGNGKTVIRGGYGIFYVDPALTLYTRTVSTQPAVLTTVHFNPASFEDPYANFPGGTPFPRARVSPEQFGNFRFTLPVAGGAMEPQTRTGYSQNWNLTVERQLFQDTAISLGYVANLGVKILAARQLNPAVSAPGASAANVNARRLYQGIGSMEFASGFQSSNFHSLQLGVTKRSRKGLTVIANYVFSKVIDNSSSTVEGDGSWPLNPFNLNQSRGVGDFDTTHRAVLSFVYDLPKTSSSNGLVKGLLNDWQLNGIMTLRSGLPFTVTSGADRAFAGMPNSFADQIGDPTRPDGADQLLTWFNPAAFRQATLGTFGNLGRNTLRGPGSAVMDISVFKNIPITDRFRLQFRAEAFNIQNRANFQNPNGNRAAGTFARITAADDPRVFQFGLKLAF